MKLLGILLLLLGALQCVRIYTTELKKQLIWLRDWERIFSCWKDWIERFSYSIDELIEQTSKDILTCKLESSNLMRGENAEQLIARISGCKEFALQDKQLVVSTLQEMGNSLTEKEIESLDRSIDILRNRIKESEKTVKERTALLYKLVPLMCGAVSVILW